MSDVEVFGGRSSPTEPYLAGEATRVVTVWDPLVRIIHWGLALLVPGAWWTAERHDVETHLLIGYAIMFLVLLRIYWGLFGGETARFAKFLAGPAAIRKYAAGLFDRRSAPSIGHNPLGAWSALLLVALLVTQVSLGLFSTDVDGLNSGPLSYNIDFELSRRFAEWHETGFYLLLAAIGLHLAAIAYYTVFKRQNLIGSMISGRRRMPEAIARPLAAGAPLHMILGVAIAATLTLAVINFT